jgi:hypothetical protein
VFKKIIYYIKENAVSEQQIPSDNKYILRPPDDGQIDQNM